MKIYVGWPNMQRFTGALGELHRRTSSPVSFGPSRPLTRSKKKHDWESLVLHVVIVSLFFKLFAYDYFRRTKCAA